MKKSSIFLLIIILSVALRFFYLGKIPNGFYSDEAAYGYNAYSLLQTGKDEYGNFLPLAFRSFGDYKAPLFIYFLVPFVWLFGLSELSIRLSAAILGIGVIILIFLLVKRLYKNELLALLSSFFVAISPFSLQFNRMAHENNLVVFLILGGLLFFFKSIESPNYIFVSLISFVLSLYTYHDARIIVPLLVLSLIFLYRKELFLLRKKLLVGLVLSLLLLLPFINLLRSEAFWSRPKFTILSSDLGISLRINDERGEDLKSAFQWPTLFHNKAISYTLTFLDNYMKHFSFDFLFLSGDPVKIYHTLGNGLLYLVSVPFLIYGLYFLFKKNHQHKYLFLSWLLLIPVPSALTRFVPSASRILSINPAFSLVISLGILASLKSLKVLAKNKIYQVLIVLFFIINIAYYLHYYYFNTNIRYAKEWHYGMRNVLEEVAKRQNNYNQVWFSKNAWGYIYPLFYLRYPPEKYQKQAKLTNLNEFGFGWVAEFDKYKFADIPDKSLVTSDTLYISSPEDNINVPSPLSIIYYPDGQVAFYIFDKNSL